MATTPTPTLNDLYGTIKDKEYALLLELKQLVDAFNTELDDLLKDTTGGNTSAAQYFNRLKSTLSYTLGQDLSSVITQYAPAPTSVTVPTIPPTT